MRAATGDHRFPTVRTTDTSDSVMGMTPMDAMLLELQRDDADVQWSSSSSMSPAHDLVPATNSVIAITADTGGSRRSRGGRPPKTVNDSKSRKRERNREWMRRARLKKRSQDSDAHAVVVALEKQRDDLMQQKKVDDATVDKLFQQQQQQRPAAAATDATTGIHRYRQLNRAYTEVEHTLGALREENCALRDRLRRHGVSTAVIHHLVEELRISTNDTLPRPLSNVPAVQEDFAWFSEIESIYEPLPLTCALQLVKESHAEIMANVRVAEHCLPASHQVFGWNDKRFLDGSVAKFMFDKAFPAKCAQELMEMTWQLSTTALRMRVLQPQTQRMKILQELNENTFVVARQNYFPMEDANLCSVYVLFRIKTHDHGFVIGTRSIEPFHHDALSKYHATGRYLFPRLVYTFQFEPLARGGNEHGNSSCLVKFGGCVDNIQVQHARNCLMDAVLAMLRWEAHCIAPILSLLSNPE